MTRRFVGAVGTVSAFWFTPTKTPPTLRSADRAMLPVFALTV